MDISKLSKQLNITASKIRYYEEKGLIKSQGRNGLKRVFSKGIVTNLSFIALAQSCGFSLKEIKGMLCAENKYKVDKKKITSKITEIDEKIKELKAMKTSLEHLNKCQAHDQFECPNFQKILKMAIKKGPKKGPS